ncbi:ATP-binding protein [Azospirillum griseum]|uniref:histidine kinase n=1 Tax=Azospirillum griseum TaxID=2496639 RepID=A0A3S0HX15_9PROT|nr:ATP-binding protein [Azospirillum griseum]RTR13444.1 hypothetical protein EJ903_24640 [Azospirillum griseum]
MAEAVYLAVEGTDADRLLADRLVSEMARIGIDCRELGAAGGPGPVETLLLIGHASAPPAFAGRVIRVGMPDTDGPVPIIEKVTVQSARLVDAVIAHVLVDDKARSAFEADWSVLEEREFREGITTLLRSLGFHPIHAFRLGPISHIATCQIDDPDGSRHAESWVVVPVDGEGRATDLERLFNSTDRTLRDRIMDRLPPTGAANLLPASRPICLLLVGRDPGRDFSGLLTLAAPPDGRVKLWSHAEMAHLATDRREVIGQVFSPLSRRLRDLLARSRNAAAQLEAQVQALQRTDQQLAWEQRRRMQAERDAVWRELSLRVAHKLGNPLATLGLMRREMEYLVEEAKELAPDRERLLAKLTEIGEALAGQKQTQKRTAQVLEEFSVYAKATGVRLSSMDMGGLRDIIAAAAIGQPVDGPDMARIERIPDRVAIDPQRMADVFEELFANAQNIAKEQDITLKITVMIEVRDDYRPRTKDLPAGRFVLVTVSDNGPGVVSDRKESVFLPFVTTRKDGTGQGLAILRRIIDDHLGEIYEDGKSQAEQRGNAGARFRIALPVLHREED